MKESGFITLRLGLETINANRQKKIGGKVTVDTLLIHSATISQIFKNLYPSDIMT